MSQSPAPARAPLLPLEQGLAQLLGYAQPVTGFERVPTLEADGRALAQDLHSDLQVPPHDNSAMDGYALRCQDLVPGQPLRVAQRIPAGAVGLPLAAHTVARVFTGAPIPPGADAVVMQEEATTVEDGHVLFPNPATPGQHIRRAGEDVARGALLLRQGQRLGPAELGLAASVGYAQLPVLRRLRVALLSTGSELVTPGTVAPAAMKPGAIYNSNRYFLATLLRRLGCEVSDLGLVPDTLDATLAAFGAAAKGHDVIVTSGGVSVGEEDHVKPAVRQLGSLDLWQLSMKPGKPFAYGRVGAAHVLGLPGNPVSSFVTFLLLARPFLLKLQGLTAWQPPTSPMRSDFVWPKADKRREFLRVQRNAQGGLDLFANQGSGVLTSMAWAHGLVDNPAGQTIAVGDTVRFIPFTELLA